jgi:hypothetical protein
MLRPTVSRPVCLGTKHRSGAYDQILIIVWQLQVCWFGTPSLTRRRVCRLQLLLAFASAVIFGSESRRTRGPILLSQIRDSPFRRLLRLAGSWVSFMIRPTVSRPVCLGIKHPFGAYDQIFITCVTVTVLFSWGVLSDESSGSVFCMCCWPLPAQSSSGPSPLGLATLFYCLIFRLPFSSPPTTRRVTVEVFDPASTRYFPWSKLFAYWIENTFSDSSLSCRKLIRWYPLPRKWTSDMFPIFRVWLLRGFITVTYETATRA